MLPLTFVGQGHSPTPLFLLLLALAIDAVFGEMPAVFKSLPHPARLIARFAVAGEAKLNRAKRSDADRRVRGGVLVVVMVAGAALGGAAVTFASHAAPHFWLLEVVLTASLISQRRAYGGVGGVAAALREGRIDAGRRALGGLVGGDVARLDAHGVARAAIDTAAQGFAAAVLAPVFWYAAIGLPGLLVYQTAAGLDAILGRPIRRYQAFGWVAGRFHRLVVRPPARLAGLFVAAAAAFVPGTRPAMGFRVSLAAKGRWAEAAMAGALGLALAGPAGDGEGRRATPRDVRQALSVYAIACLMVAGSVAALLWASVAVGRT